MFAHAIFPFKLRGMLKLRVRSTLREILTRGIHRSSCFKRLRFMTDEPSISFASKHDTRTACHRRRESRAASLRSISCDYENFATLCKTRTRAQSATEQSPRLLSRDRRYWHVASPRVSELRGPRMSPVSLTLSGENISIFTSSLGARTKKSRSSLETSSFDLSMRSTKR